MMDPELFEHADYPHTPGTLYDCPACEAVCYCEEQTPGKLCLYCLLEQEAAAETEWKAHQYDCDSDT